MNIAFLTPEYPHPKVLNSAGIGTSIKNLAVELIKRDCKITIFVYGQDVDEVIEEGTIKIHKIAHKKFIFGGWYLYRKHLQNEINKCIKSEQIQLIEAPDWTGITAFIKFKCPLLIRLHGTDAYFCHLEGRKQKLKNFIFEKLALKSATSIVSVSEFTAKKTKQLFNISKKISVINNGIDTTKFLMTNTEVVPNTILYFGSIIRKKGVLELANIFNLVVEKIPEATLILLGQDVIDIFENKSTIKLFYEKLSESALRNVKYIPQVPYNKVKEYIAKASVIVLPSFAEAFPMTWLEAMALGKALVTSNIGWAKEIIIDGKTGFTEHPKNHKEFASKVIQFLENKKLSDELGENAMQHIKMFFSSKTIVEKNINFYKEILNEA